MSDMTQSVLEILKGFATAGDREGYYNSLGSLGGEFGSYSRLALGVVTGGNMSGRSANVFLVEKAHSKYNISLDEAAVLKISVDLMNTDLAARQDAFREGDTGPLNFRDIQAYHEVVFKDAGLGVDAWTAYVPLKLAYEHPDLFQGWIISAYIYGKVQHGDSIFSSQKLPIFESGADAQQYMWEMMLKAENDWLLSPVINIFESESLLMLGFVRMVAIETGDPDAKKWADDIDTSLLSHSAYIVGNLGSPFSSNEASRCFPSGTLISAPGGDRRIETVLPGDIVFSYDGSADDGRGALVPKRVVRLFRNETEEWLRLMWREGDGDRELVVTPGHHFLDARGQFRQIDAIIADAEPTVVLADGSLAQVRAERIVWSAETRHM
ncbi:MAG: hypothetical protein LBE86_00295, partial [Gemmobacter sp.]|nr:hypothetical protein [Gemmobacter sp.]